MARNTHKNVAPAPVHTAQDNQPKAVTGNENDTKPVNASRPLLWVQKSSETTGRIADKSILLQTAGQYLAEARDYFKDGEGKAKEATAVAAKAASALYQAQTRGLSSKEETSAVLGNVFGYKKKEDGSDSKTPDGQGEAIRKRIVRAVAAAEYVTSGNGGGFFATLPNEAVDEVASVVDAIESGDTSIYSAYDRFAEIKRDYAIRTELAFDAKRIAALVAKLSEPGSAAVVQSSPELVATYTALYEVLLILGEPVEEGEEGAE